MSEQKTENKEPVERATKVVKGIERTLNTGKYESIRIVTTVEETITWSSLQERNEKIEKLTKHVIRDFEKTKDEVMQELGLAEKRAFDKNALDDKEAVVVDKDVFDTL